MSEDDNPFENVPEDLADGGQQAGDSGELETARPETAPAPSVEDFRNLPPLPPELGNKSRLAMAAGFGFVFLVVLVYVGIVMPGGFDTYLFGISGMILATLVALFYMLDDLRIRPAKVTERGTRFVAGIILALLFLLSFGMTSFLWPDYIRLGLLISIMVVTNASFALFFYSMLWEE